MHSVLLMLSSTSLGAANQNWFLDDTEAILIYDGCPEYQAMN
jgi:hypothetical protein